MGVSFFSKPTKSDKLSIYCSVHFKNVSRFHFAVPNMRISKADWSNGRVKTGRGKQQNSHQQAKLDEIRKVLEAFNTEYASNYYRSPRREDFLNFLDSQKTIQDFFNTSKVFQIVPLIEKIIDERNAGIDLNNGKSFAENTLKSYVTFLNTLKAFEKIELRLNTKNIIENDTINRFQLFLVRNQLKLNTVGRRLKHLSTFLELLHRRGFIDINPFEKFKIPIPSEESISIALSEQELEELGLLDLSTKPTYELVRDQFLAMCWTGLRISDFKHFVSLNITSEKIISTHNQKTGKMAHIPVLPPLRSILAKYDGRFPRMISEQKMRDYLKEIAKLLPSMHKEIEIQFTVGGKTKKVHEKKFNLVHLHTARRTLATLLYRRKFPMEQIMLITGHKTTAALKRYLKVTEREVLSEMISAFEEQSIKGDFATVPATIVSNDSKTP
jgi:site-specific recombinase XerD